MPNREQKIKEVEALAEQHSNAIAVFGGLLWIETIDDIATQLPFLMRRAKFYEWHEGVIGAMRTLCHLCYVDPALVEAYIGMRFEKLCEVLYA